MLFPGPEFHQKRKIFHDRPGTSKPLLAFLARAGSHSLGFHGRVHPTFRCGDHSIADVLEELDAFVDRERRPLLLVVLEDRKRFVPTDTRSKRGNPCPTRVECRKKVWCA